jgi:hypothetical protein
MRLIPKMECIASFRRSAHFGPAFFLSMLVSWLQDSFSRSLTPIIS